MKNAARILIVVLISVLIVGCATMNTVKPMPGEVDAKVKGLSPPAGKSLVYVVRPTLLGKPYGGYITSDDEVIGTTQGGMYVYAVLAPGEHKFKVTGHDNDPELVVNLEADKTYFIQQNVYPGLLKGITKLTMLSEEEGRKTLAECELSDQLGANTAH